MWMKAPEGVGSVSAGGKQYKADKNGLVNVPANAAEELKSHGLKPSSPPAKEPEKKPGDSK